MLTTSSQEATVTVQNSFKNSSTTTASAPSSAAVADTAPYASSTGSISATSPSIRNGLWATATSPCSTAISTPPSGFLPCTPPCPSTLVVRRVPPPVACTMHCSGNGLTSNGMAAYCAVRGLPKASSSVATSPFSTVSVGHRRPSTHMGKYSSSRTSTNTSTTSTA